MGATQLQRTTPADRRPNFVIILADDMGYGDLACYGNAGFNTPHLDRLAAEGARFTDFHVSAPVCSPSRASLLTGRYPQRAGIPEVIFADPGKGTYDLGLHESEVTFSRLLHQAGYSTAVFGKWHLGYHLRFNPLQHGFERFRGYVSGNIDYVSHMNPTGMRDWWDGRELVDEEGYSTHLITKHAVDFLAQKHDRPFCLYIAHQAVHSPYQGPDDKPIRTYDGETLPGRQDRRQAYREMTEALDDSVGEVMATIRSQGLADNTLVFFFSDNGATRVGSNLPLRGGKSTLWEGGHRVPAIAWWPGHIHERCPHDEFLSVCDLMPTMLSLAGVPLPQGHRIDGIDLSPLLLSGEKVGDRMWFWQHRGATAVRQGDWKMVRTKDGEVSLFDLAVDIAEQSNLVDRYPQRAQAMLAAVRAWQGDVLVDHHDLEEG